MSDLSFANIAILATNGFEKSELFEPKKQLAEAGATITIISPDTGSIKSWADGDWGESVDVDLALSDATASDYDALVLPGGQINPDVLRANSDAVDFIRDFAKTEKPLAAICHAPWLLIEAGLVKDKRMTSYGSIATDMINAGAKWEDSEVVTDGAIITARQPEDLDAFCNTIITHVSQQNESIAAA